MAAILLFDTLIFSKRLIKAGMPKQQAEALAEAHKHSLQDSLKNGLASKKDVIKAKEELSAEITEIKIDMQLMRKEFEGKFNLLYWMMGFVLTFCISNFFLVLKPYL